MTNRFLTDEEKKEMAEAEYNNIKKKLEPKQAGNINIKKLIKTKYYIDKTADYSATFKYNIYERTAEPLKIGIDGDTPKYTFKTDEEYEKWEEKINIENKK